MDCNHGSSDSDRFYGEFYERVNWTKGIGAFAVRGMHRKMEKEYANGHFETCLELGGGSGQHLDYVLHGFNSYVLVDLREAQLSLKWASDPRVRSVTGDAENIPFHDKYFDRVVITCLLHHVDNPEKVLQEVDRVLKIGGVATIFLPCDPGLLVRLTRRLTTQRLAKKLGFPDYKLYLAREHKNHVASIVRLAQHTFRNRKPKFEWSPLPFQTWNLNAFLIIRIGKSTKSQKSIK